MPDELDEPTKITIKCPIGGEDVQLHAIGPSLTQGGGYVGVCDHIRNIKSDSEHTRWLLKIDEYDGEADEYDE